MSLPEDRMNSPRTHPISAFTLIEFLVTIACVLMVVALILPRSTRSKAWAAQMNCTMNLKQIDLGFRTWAFDNYGRFPMQVSITNGGTMELVSSGFVFPHFLVMSNELSTPNILLCPNDKKRTYTTSFTGNLADANLSYFINVDSAPGDGSSLLCGDRNLTNKAPAGSRFVSLFGTPVIGWTKDLHNEKGNLCYADGSVRGFTNGAAALTLRLPPGATNRLVMP